MIDEKLFLLISIIIFAVGVGVFFALLILFQAWFDAMKHLDETHETSCEVPIKSVTNYSCPNCGGYCSEKTLISKTTPEWCYVPDPCYNWKETHRCHMCETLYTLNNGT